MTVLPSVSAADLAQVETFFENFKLFQENALTFLQFFRTQKNSCFQSDSKLGPEDWNAELAERSRGGGEKTEMLLKAEAERCDEGNKRGSKPKKPLTLRSPLTSVLSAFQSPGSASAVFGN